MSAYKGSSDKLTSTELVDILAEATIKPFYVFSFINTEAWHVKINGSDPIFLDAGQGFDLESRPAISEQIPPINSFMIVESGISYQWIGIS